MGRKYSEKTIKILFALSGNQCAHPECEKTVIEPTTEDSDAAVIAQICHIYAIKKKGPRGKDGLTKKELNSPENLILLCPTHHVVVDAQHESYPADMLKEWKQAHEFNEMQRRISKDSISIHADFVYHPNFPAALVDQEIENDVGILRKSRFFVEFDSDRSSLEIARKLVAGELSGGTDAVRARGLAWCVRFLSASEELDKAKEYLTIAKSLGRCPEIDIAEAFISSRKGDKSAALRTLAGIDLPIARSTAVMIVAHHDGAEGSVDWLKTAGIGATDLNADGKLFLLSQLLDLARWEAAREVVEVLNDQDLEETPVLHHMTAITHLLCTVPVEFRTAVRHQLPLAVAEFPLASDAAAINIRRAAYRHFSEASAVARELNCTQAASSDDEYALWLELKDPETADDGRGRLKFKLHDPKSALHLVLLGVQFGLKLDLAAIEQEIERQIALHGEITIAAATARFALAFKQDTPEASAKYIARHFAELSKYIDKKSMQSVQIDMLSQAGRLESARECLHLLLEQGLSEAEESRIRNVIAEAAGTDPFETRKDQFKQTDSLVDLGALVEELESKEEWDSLCEYGETLFEGLPILRTENPSS